MSHVCQKEHKQPCSARQGMIIVANTVIKDGFMTLKSAFKLVSPNVLQYKAPQVRRKILRMPLACVGVGDRSKGNYSFFIVEKQETVNYTVFQTLLAKASDKPSLSETGLSKNELKELLYLAESESQREMLKYVAIKASGLSNSKAKKDYGICDIQKRAEKLDRAVQEARAIRESIEKIANLKDKALLSSFGFQVNSDSESDLSESESEDEPASDEDQTNDTQPSLVPAPSCLARSEGDSDVSINSIGPARVSELQVVSNNDYQRNRENTPEINDLLHDTNKFYDMLKSCSFNWFQFAFTLQPMFDNMSKDDVSRLLSEFGTMIPSLNIDMEDLSALTQSRSAFLLLEEVPWTNNEHEESIVSESDSSDQEIWNQGISDVLGENGRKVITKRRASIRWKAMMLGAERCLAPYWRYNI